MALSGLYVRIFSTERVFVKKIRSILGFTPGNIKLYKTAFRHKSVAQNIKNGVKNSNERLEYLGDAVLGLVVAEVLFKMYPFKEEGFLTEMRSKMVSRSYLNQLSLKLGLEQLIACDPKTISYGVKHNALLGDAFEALVGAIYLDKGYKKVRKFLVKRIIDSHIDILALEQTETNHKSRLLEWGQKHSKKISFESLENVEDKNSRIFSVQVYIDQEPFGIGKAFNKKDAEKLASEKTLDTLSVE